MGHGDRLTDLLSEDPSAPYEYLYTSVFATKQEATDEINRLGARLGKNLCSRTETNRDSSGKTKQKGCKLGVYGCSCTGCSSSLGGEKLQPFQLCLRSTTKSGTPLFHFDRNVSQHRHGPLCARERNITESIGSLPEVQRIVQANLAAGNGELMRLLVKELHYGLPSGVTVAKDSCKLRFIDI
jgi:hypothetical protein